MAIAHLITLNNESTIEKSIKSVIPFVKEVVISDLGSRDKTLEICKNYSCIIDRRNKTEPRDSIRNRIATQYNKETILFINPWEHIKKITANLDECKKPLIVHIINNTTITKEIRVCKGNDANFENYVFEQIYANKYEISNILFQTCGQPDYDYFLSLIEQWKIDKPTSTRPWYYESCIHFAKGNLESFINLSIHYMKLDKSLSMASILNRYYFCLANLLLNKNHKDILKNINICIAHRPLMAEFWCLLADVFFFSYKNYYKARHFYENAIIMGKYRTEDIWPIDISKYSIYPGKMISFINKLLEIN